MREVDYIGDAPLWLQTYGRAGDMLQHNNEQQRSQDYGAEGTTILTYQRQYNTITIQFY